jgi:hypothetical protein
MTLDEGVNGILSAIFNYPTAAMLIVAFWIYVWRDRRPY